VVRARPVVHVGLGGSGAGGASGLGDHPGAARTAGWGASGKRFSTAAGVALAVIAASGAQRALNEVGAWGRLWSNTFGKWVLLKIVLFAALAGLGALNRYRNVGRTGTSPRPLRRVSGVELLIIGMVLVATGFLQNLAPATSAAAPKAPPPVV